MIKQDAVGGTPVEEADIPVDELLDDDTVELMNDMLDSMRRLSTDEERRREIGKMLV